MAAGMPQHDRVVRGNRAQRVMRWEALHAALWHLVPLFLVPTAAPDQLTGRRIPGHRVDHRHDLVPVRHIHDIKLHVGIADSEEVTVTLDETGDGQHAVKIDDLGVGTDIRSDLPIRSDGDDGISFDSNGLAIGNVFVHRDDLATSENQVGFDFGRRHTARHESGEGRQCE